MWEFQEQRRYGSGEIWEIIRREKKHRGEREKKKRKRDDKKMNEGKKKLWLEG